MTDSQDPVFPSTLRVGAERFTARHPKITADADGARFPRSVLRKPAAETYVEHPHQRLEQLARSRPPGAPPAHHGPNDRQ